MEIGDMVDQLNKSLETESANMIMAGLLTEKAMNLLQQVAERNSMLNEMALEALMQGIEASINKGITPGPGMTATLQQQSAIAAQIYTLLTAKGVVPELARAVSGMAIRGERLAPEAIATKVVALDMNLPDAARVANILLMLGVKVVIVNKDILDEEAAKVEADRIDSDMKSLGAKTASANYFVLLSEKNMMLAEQMKQMIEYKDVMVAIKTKNVTWREALSCYVDYLDNGNSDRIADAPTKEGVQKLKHSTELAKARSEQATSEADTLFLSELESDLNY
jgi:hypothetical protein